MEKDMTRPVYIIGHKNPDTDSICSALAYAYLKNTCLLYTSERAELQAQMEKERAELKEQAEKEQQVLKEKFDAEQKEAYEKMQEQISTRAAAICSCIFS